MFSSSFWTKKSKEPVLSRRNKCKTKSVFSIRQMQTDKFVFEAGMFSTESGKQSDSSQQSQIVHDSQFQSTAATALGKGYMQDAQMSRLDFVRLLFQNGISFNVDSTDKLYSNNSLSGRKDFHNEILTAQRRKVRSLHNEAEVKITMESIRKDMEETKFEPKMKELFPPEILFENQQREAKLIAARKRDISEEEKSNVKEIFRRPNPSQIVIDKFNIDMTVTKISCLKPSAWLNDEAVNFYMALLQQRDDKLCATTTGEVQQRRGSHYFNSFFLDRLVANGVYNYSNVKRWSKKFDVFEKDKIFMPINIRNTHWTMAVAYIQRKEIHYYDSMSGCGKLYLQSILQWLQDEAKEKKKIELDITDWKLIDRERDVPQQNNGVDCGLFSIICADYLSDDLPISSYSQNEMPNNRVKVAAAIVRGYITY